MSPIGVRSYKPVDTGEVLPFIWYNSYQYHNQKNDDTT